MTTRWLLLGGLLTQALLSVALLGTLARPIVVTACAACVVAGAVSVRLIFSPTPAQVRLPGLIAGLTGGASALMLALHGFGRELFWATFPEPWWVFLPWLSCVLFLLATVLSYRSERREL
ncbi:hypothetical protein [Corynebacterium sp.]|uniref:hypothetical protein n=1 Tax=Corynebacterium sp. TaxID=1720 RepID=UPI0026E08171|nr:hypothetical protein [Corynebacterium sp.]MDO5511873.1 hypothetical protein [Corynebacterium sp.]